ncbi:MAG: hypothetical protein IAE83_04110 [Anaerolinea sp.]|nr:hypothetical protein [Anaerolinea sp.]MCC6974150.1 hypothetical protein [Anaerolineae bacterium]
MIDEKAVIELILTHVRRYDAIDVLDVYKLLHQGVFGPGHAIENKRSAKEWLEQESKLLRPNPNEALVESIHPTGAVVRLHLRPYLALNGSLPKLLEAFIESSVSIVGDPVVMGAWWRQFEKLTEAGGPLANRFLSRTVLLVGKVRAAEQWSAVHHSPPFDRTYKPAYRVLSAPLAENLLRSQKFEYKVL